MTTKRPMPFPTERASCKSVVDVCEFPAIWQIVATDLPKIKTANVILSMFGQTSFIDVGVHTEEPQRYNNK
jgi:hypothetical protein